MTAPTAPGWIRAVARPVVDAWLRLDVAGAEHVPADGAVILAPHHCSHADVLAVGAAAPRPVTFLGSDHLTQVPVLGPLLPRLGMLPVVRGHADREALERCLDALGGGAALVIFPEGSRSRDGHVYRPRSGVARLATAVGCPVVPVGVHGTAAVWPVDERPRVRGGRVEVRFGAPLDPPGDDPGARRAFADRLHDDLVRLSRAPRADGLLRRAS